MADTVNSGADAYSETEDVVVACELDALMIWRRNLRYILWALGGGIIVGTPFLIFAFAIRAMAAPLYPWLFFMGGVSIIVCPAAVTAYETWRACTKICR